MKEELKKRTQIFALRIIRLCNSLPPTQAGSVLGRQLLRCGTSVGANYRAACRAKSTADFVNKLKITEEEADETLYWLELLAEAGIVKPHLLESIIKEADELVAIFTSALKTTKQNMK